MPKPKKKHPCPDCKFCQWCSDSRCNGCKGWLLNTKGLAGCTSGNCGKKKPTATRTRKTGA